MCICNLSKMVKLDKCVEENFKQDKSRIAAELVQARKKKVPTKS